MDDSHPYYYRGKRHYQLYVFSTQRFSLEELYCICFLLGHVRTCKNDLLSCSFNTFPIMGRESPKEALECVKVQEEFTIKVLCQCNQSILLIKRDCINIVNSGLFFPFRH